MRQTNTQLLYRFTYSQKKILLLILAYPSVTFTHLYDTICLAPFFHRSCQKSIFEGLQTLLL